MRKAKGAVLCTLGIVIAIISVGCGDSIQNAQSNAAMFGWMFASFAFMAVAILLCALGVSAEQDEEERASRKVKRVPHHSNDWRNAE